MRWLGPWWLPLGGGGALAALRVLAPDLPWHVIVPAWAVATATLVLGRARAARLAPLALWLLFAGAIVSCTGGLLVARLGPGVPTSLDQAFHVIAHGLAGAGLMIMARRYTAGDPDAWLDGAVAGLAIALTIWDLLLAGIDRATAVPDEVAIFCIVVSAASFVGLARTVIRPLGPPTFTLTVAAFGLVLLNDIAAYAVGADRPLAQVTFEAGWLLGYGCWAALAGHPATAYLQAPAYQPVRSPDTEVAQAYRSAIVMATAVAVLTLVTWRQLYTGHGADIHVGVSFALVAVVAIRLARIVHHLGDGIRERHRAEEALRRSEARFRSVAELAPVGIYEADANGLSIFQNRYWGELTGMSPADATARGWEATIHPEDRWVIRDWDTGRQEGREFGSEHRYLRPDGSVRWVTANTSPIRDDAGQITGWVGIVLDVTHLIEQRRIALEREAFVNALVDQSPVGIEIFNPDGDAIAINRAQRHIYDLPDPGPGGLAFNVLAATGDDGASPREGLERAFAGQTVSLAPRRVDVEAARRTYGAPIRHVPPGGGPGPEVWVKETFFPVRSDSGQVQAVISFTEDVTGPTLADESRRTIEAKLQESAKLEALGVLAGGIAHDFNNLLVAILGHAGLARAEHAAGADPSADIAAVETAAHRAADLARQMLAYSGRGHFVVAPVRLDTLLDEMGDLLSRSIAKNAVLRREFAPDLPPVVGDATQLRQVALNLIVNASDALGGEPGTITLRTGLVDVRAGDPDLVAGIESRTGTYVALEVADTGGGMDRATLRRIFDPFFSTKSTGRGLGLAATLGIVKGHGGLLRVRSAPGQGTRFQVLLMPTVALAAAPRQVAPGRGAAGVAGRAGGAPTAPATEAAGEAAPPSAPSPDLVASVPDPRATGSLVAVTAARSARAAVTAALPASGPLPANADPCRPEASRRGRILVVDDEESVRRLGRRALERAGFAVHEVGDGPEAIAAFGADPDGFSGILLDLTLPTLDGLTVLERVREVRPRVPVVISSGWAAEEVADRLREHAGVRFLGKPYTVEALAAVFD